MEKSSMVSAAPADALKTTGVKEALLRVEIATAVTPMKAAVRRSAPRFCGSSMLSKRRMRGFRPVESLGTLIMVSVPLISVSSRDW